MRPGVTDACPFPLDDVFMQSREIDPREWRQFTEAFSRRHEGWLVSLFVERLNGERDYIVRDVPFRGMAAETDGQRQTVVVMVDGGGARHLTHTIARPSRIVVTETDEGAESAVSVTPEAGAVITTEFRTPMPAVEVDGIVSKESNMNAEQPEIKEELPIAQSLHEWGFDLATFEAKAKSSIANARGDLSEITGVLRQTMASTKQTLLDLQKSRGPVAAELKSGFERAWDEIEQAFARARQKMRETRQAPASGNPDDV
jgi:hypothetical protein